MCSKSNKGWDFSGLSALIISIKRPYSRIEYPASSVQNTGGSLGDFDNFIGHLIYSMV